MMRKVILILSFTILMLTMTVLTTSCNVNFADIEYHTVGDGETLKVGIISDIHMPADADGTDYTDYFEKALKIFKENGVEVLIIAGDFTDLATKYSYERYVETYDKVYGDDELIVSYIMGNHDYWLKFGATVPKMRRRFREFTGEKPFNHKVVNGYHFIGWSSEDGTYDKSYREEKWIREQIELAIQDNSDNPIFVTTHIAPPRYCIW